MKGVSKHEKTSIQSNPAHNRERLGTQDQSALNRIRDDSQFTAPHIQSYSHEKKVEKDKPKEEKPPNTVPINSDTK